MNLFRRLPFVCFILGSLLLGSACSAAGQGPPSPEMAPPDCVPTDAAPRTLSELIQDLQEENYCVRRSAALALAEMGEEASSAVPELTRLLYSDGPWELRSAAAFALGEIGSASKPAVPVLIAALLGDFVHVQSAAADALGKIGDRSAVPALALALRTDQTESAIDAAEALAILTGQEFPGLGRPAYELNEESLPLLVVAAQQWWDQTGRFESWITP